MTVSRTTQLATSQSALRGLQASLARSQRLQEQLSSGRRVARPADDPSATGAAMQLRSQRRADEQYLRNIEDASGRLGTADNALQTISERVRRARDLLVSSQSGAMDANGRVAVSVELDSLRSDITDLYNTSWLGRPVFGGTVAGGIAVDSAGAYVGDEMPVVARISRDATIRTDVRGTDAAADVLPGLLQQASTDVTSDPAAVGGDLTALDAALAKVLQGLGDVGARASRLDLTKSNIDSERLGFTSRISENEDIDLPEAIMNLQSQQVAYQSALGAAAKVLQVSLVDFLR